MLTWLYHISQFYEAILTSVGGSDILGSYEKIPVAWRLTVGNEVCILSTEKPSQSR